MKIAESRKIIAVLMATYQNYKPIDTNLAAEVWADMTEEYTYKQVDMALRMYMKTDTTGFAPTPAQIIDRIHTLTTPGELNEAEAWALVRKALRNSGYNAEEEFAKLPPIVQRAVGFADQLRDWALTDDLNHEVVMASFQRAYREERQKAMDLKKMPQMVRDMVAKINENSYSGQIEQKRQEAMKSSTERKQGEIKALEERREGVPMPPGYMDVLMEKWGMAERRNAE